MLVFVCCCAVDSVICSVFWTVPSLKSKKQVPEISLRSLPHCKSMTFFVNFVVFQANILHLEQAFLKRDNTNISLRLLYT